MEQTCEMDMETMRQECSRKVSDLEKRLHITVMEKDALKVSLHDAEVEVSRRRVVDDADISLEHDFLKTCKSCSIVQPVFCA